jgi:hypothetical protein
MKTAKKATKTKPAKDVEYARNLRLFNIAREVIEAGFDQFVHKVQRIPVYKASMERSAQAAIVDLEDARALALDSLYPESWGLSPDGRSPGLSRRRSRKAS